MGIVAAVRQAGVDSHMYSFITRAWAREAKRCCKAAGSARCWRFTPMSSSPRGVPGRPSSGTPRQEEDSPNGISWSKPSASWITSASIRSRWYAG